MKYTISILADAVSDLEEAYLWYELNQPGLGSLFIRNVKKHLKQFQLIHQASSEYIKKPEDSSFINFHTGFIT